MFHFKYITRNDQNPKGKPSIFFCCHPNDLKHLDQISQDILKKVDCTIWYNKSINQQFETNHLDFLIQMQLIVMPITADLLCTNNDALNMVFPFAKKNHIPFLPILLDEKLETLFNNVCGHLHLIKKYNSNLLETTYEEALKKYLDLIFINNSLEQRIRDAFDTYIFLSYRKKDYKKAQELMNLIHNNRSLRRIAIWYDKLQKFRNKI